jgi:hypothetical protein
MSTIARPNFATVSGLAASVRRYVLLAFEAIVEAKKRRIRNELEFRRSFDAYRAGKNIPPLNDDLRAGS